MDNNNNTYKEIFSDKPRKKNIFSGMSKGMLIALGAGALVILVLIGVIIALIVGGGDGGETVGESSAVSGEALSSDAFSLTAPDLVGKMWNDELAESIKPVVILPKNIVYDMESDAPRGQILSQTPEAGTKLFCDENGVCSYVKITVSGKEFSTAYSGIIGKTAEEAMNWLWECGVKKEDVFRKYSASTTGVGNGCVSAFTYENGGAVEEGVTVKEGDRFIITINSYTDSVTVPHLGGKTFEEAVELLYQSKLNIGEITYKESGFADGTVLSQSPASDETAYYGDKIDLVLSQRAGAFKMPELLGMTGEEAEGLLADFGLELGTVTEVSNREYDHGTVCWQNVEPDAEVFAATVIDIKIAKGGRIDPEVDWNADTVIIDLTNNTILSAGSLEKIMRDCSRKQVIATGDRYNWVLPKGAEYPRDDARLELGVDINGGEGYSDAVDILRDMGFDLGSFAVINRKGEDKLPSGTTLSVELGFAFSGYNVKMLTFDDKTGKFTEKEASVYAVTENGTVTVPVEGEKLFALVMEGGVSYSVKVEYDDGTVYCEEGSLITVQGGDSLTLHFGAKEGYVIDTVTINGVVLEGVNGVYTIPSVNSEHTVVITAKAEE